MPLLPLLLLLLICFPRCPHGLLIFAFVCARQVSNRVLQESLVRALPLQGPPHKRSHAVILHTLLQLLCICNDERGKATRSLRAHRTLLLWRFHAVALKVKHVLCAVSYSISSS
jgi:hypothetical protein